MEQKALHSLNNGSQLLQVKVMKYTPSFSGMALRTGMVEVTGIDRLLCFVGRMSFPTLMALLKRHSGNLKSS